MKFDTEYQKANHTLMSVNKLIGPKNNYRIRTVASLNTAKDTRQLKTNGVTPVNQIQRKPDENEYRITSTAGKVIKVGEVVTYEFHGDIAKGTNFTWVIENDPNTFGAFSREHPDLLRRFSGHTNERQLRLIAEIPGNHIIRVDVSKEGQYVASEVYTQVVLPKSATDDEIFIQTVGIAAPISANSLQPGITKVTPEVAFNILDNMSKKQPPFKPELGKGGCSWFVTEGNPYTSVEHGKSIGIPVEINRTSHPIVFNESELLKIHDQILSDPRLKAEVELKYRQYNKLPSDQSFNSRQQKSVFRALERAAESRMWDEVAKQVKGSQNGVGEVNLKNSRFSIQGDGKFLVVADGSKIQIKGGMEAVIASLKSSGLEAPSVISEAAKLEFARVKNVGRVLNVFKWGGRILLIVGIARDLYRIYTAEDRYLTTVKVVGGWAGAIGLGSIFASWFTPADSAGPWAWVAHGVGTLIAGGIGYFIGSETAASIYKIIIME